MVRMGILLAVATGGAIGSLARYGLARWLQPRGASGFPYGTLTANLIGCLAIGMCLVWFERRVPSESTREFLRVGLLGGLTTFSSFCIEAFAMMDRGQGALAIGYIAGSVIGGLAAVGTGFVVGRILIA